MKLMKTAVLLGATAMTVTAVNAAPAMAQDALEVEGNIAFVSDYRFRGVSLSDRNFAIQGGFDLGLPGGLYVGTWASTIDELSDEDGDTTADAEVDVYGGYAFDVGALSFDVGGLAYMYPGANNNDYVEVYGSVGTTLGELIDVAALIAYSPAQGNIATTFEDSEEDEILYLNLSAEAGIPDTPFSVFASVGYEDGAFSDIDGEGEFEKIDYSLGVGYSAFGLDFSATYIGTDKDSAGADDTVVFGISKAL